MNSRTVETIISKIEKENEIFSNKGSLDSLSYNPKKIIGRHEESEQLLRYLMGYKKGYLVPLVSIYGRSGSGKSTLVRYVCEQLDNDIQLCFVNLRQAKTIFGAANVILTKLGEENVTSASGINNVLEKIGQGIKSSLVNSKKKLLVLVLDEFDVLFFDKRSNPSDFVYKLVEMESDVRKQAFQFCIITISNNVLFDYDLDDRVRSRIGSSEVFFRPYTEKDVLAILTERARDAFKTPLEDEILQYCAKRSSKEHGDARRAIDLLRIASELASSRGEVISIKHIDLASDELQKDRIEQVLSSSPLHIKYLLVALAMRTFGLNLKWHSTDSIFKKYHKLISPDATPLKYRRISEYLKELENTGIVDCRTISRGRAGYGSDYALKIPPEIVGKTITPDYWKEIEQEKAEQESRPWNNKNSFFSGGYLSELHPQFRENDKDFWR